MSLMKDRMFPVLKNILVLLIKVTCSLLYQALLLQTGMLKLAKKYVLYCLIDCIKTVNIHRRSCTGLETL